MEDKISLKYVSDKKNNLALYTISVAAELVGTTDQTLRLYEKHGLIKPSRKNKNRYYSDNDIKWLQCLRDSIHKKKISIEGIKKLLSYAPCWEITECSSELKNNCSAFIDKTKSCWEINDMICKRENGSVCSSCIIFLKHNRETTNSSKT